MSFLTRLFGGRIQKRAITYEQALRCGLLEAPTASGVTVSADSALTVSAVYSAVRIISTGIGSLPLVLYQRRPDGGRDRATDHPVYDLLHDQPNPESTPATFWETGIAHLLIHGNLVAEIERANDGTPLALWLLPADQVRIERTAAGQLVYKLGENVLDPADVFHVPGYSCDGVTGIGVVKWARESFGLTKAMETSAASFFGNGMRAGGVLEYPGTLTDPARENLRKSMAQLHAGASNTGKMMLLEEGMKYNPLAISNEDAQWLQGRQFQIQEVARWFQISPTKLADLGRATWSNLASENLSFIQQTLRPHMVKVEQEVRRKLLSRDERRDLYGEFLIDGVLRGLTKDRYDAYAVGIGAGFLLRSECRAWENLPAVEGIDDAPAPSIQAGPPAPQDPQVQDPAGNPADALDQQDNQTQGGE